MNNLDNPYKRPKAIARKPRHDFLAGLILKGLGIFVLFLAFVGANYLWRSFTQPKPLTNNDLVVLAESTSGSLPVTTFQKVDIPTTTRPILTTVLGDDEPQTTTSSTSTSSTTTTLPPLVELEPVGLDKSKLVKVALTWTGRREPSQYYEIGEDYIAAVSDDAAGPTAEGFIWVEIPTSSVSVSVNQVERVYELTVNKPPILSYSLWSQNNCKLFSSGQPQTTEIGPCPGMADGEGRISAPWKQGVFYPWFSRSRCVGTDNVNAISLAQEALRQKFAKTHGLKLDSVQVKFGVEPKVPGLPFIMPTPSPLDGYELSVVWQSCQVA